MAPEASVAVEAAGSGATRHDLLRIYRAAGLACDAAGIDRARVRLVEGRDGRHVVAHGSGPGTSIEMDVSFARAASPGALLEEAGAALGDAGPPVGGLGEAAVPGGSPARVVLLENPFTDPDREDRPRSMACGTFQLASALTAAGIEVAVVEGRFHPGRGLDDAAPLLAALGQAPTTLVGVTLLEACVTSVQALAGLVASTSDALVAVGGPMVTLSPEHAAAHVAGASLFVRGPGEAALPALARLVAGGISPAAVEAIMDMDGVLFIADGLLVAGHPCRVNRPDPDEAPMDFGLLGPEHLGGGLSIETSRGCTNPCLFCTSPGRGSHEGRSGEAVERHLGAYERRLAEIFGDDPPRPALRLQICDDDFTCDPDHAIEVLEAVGRSRLRLSSFQASVRDFLDRSGGGGLHEGLLDAIRPDLFQDAPGFSSLGDHAPRGTPPARTASFVHLGVEALGDADLRRLGKGYTTADVERLVAAMDARGIVHDAYLILSGPGTTLDDLATTLLEAMRLKIEHPRTFFVRIPVVPFLVPVFPSGSYRVWATRAGKGMIEGDVEVERVLSVPGFPEYDYPVVTRGVPADPDVREACEGWERIVEPDGLYALPARNLESWLRARLAGIREPARAARVRRTVRRLAGALPRTVYSGLARARANLLEEGVAAAYWRAADALGPAEDVAREARNAMDAGDPRLVVIPTRDCSLRCTYCPMDKEDGKIMSEETLDRAVELLLSSGARSVILQFFGGEALLRRDFVLDGMDRAMDMARTASKHIGFILSTNGTSLDDELLERLSSLPVKVEVSVDGPPEVHDRHRRPRDGSGRSYEMATRCARALVGSSIPHDVIMVVTPDTVKDLSRSFDHVASLGFRKIQVNHALSVMWSRDHMEAFARELSRIEQGHYRDGVPGPGAELLDLRTFRRPMLLNGEITVDFDGTVYFGNGFLVRTADPARFFAGHVDDLENMDTYTARRLDNDTLIELTYPRDVARNNYEVGRIFGSFVEHMRRRFPELASPEPVRSPGSGHPR